MSNKKELQILWGLVRKINNTIFEKFDLSGFIYDFITIESDKVKGRLKYEVVDLHFVFVQLPISTQME